MVSEQWIEKEFKEISRELIQGTIPGICVEGQKKLEKSPAVYRVSSLRF
jgi:hypothetical protein